MAVEGSNIQKELDPLANAERQFEEAATRLNLPQGIRDLIKRPRRATIASLPVHMDDGTIRVFTGYRVQHSIVRGPDVLGRSHRRTCCGSVEAAWC